MLPSKRPSKQEIDVWYDKLAKSGFEDIEERHSPREMLKQWHSHSFRSSGTPDQFVAKQEHYLSALHVLRNYKFATKLDRQVWACYAYGKSIRKTERLIGVKRDVVHRTLTRLKYDIFGIRKSNDNNKKSK